jgi:hypothetical protein
MRIDYEKGLLLKDRFDFIGTPAPARLLQWLKEHRISAVHKSTTGEPLTDEEQVALILITGRFDFEANVNMFAPEDHPTRIEIELKKKARVHVKGPGKFEIEVGDFPTISLNQDEIDRITQ